MWCYVKCEWIWAVAFHVMFHIKYARFDRWFECNSYWQVLIKMHGSVWCFLLVVHLIKFALHIIIGAGASLGFCWLFEIIQNIENDEYFISLQPLHVFATHKRSNIESILHSAQLHIFIHPYTFHLTHLIYNIWYFNDNFVLSMQTWCNYSWCLIWNCQNKHERVCSSN